VFRGEPLLVSYHRPANIDGAKHAWAILKLLVGRLREVWPEVRIIPRADGGFRRHKLLSWCERHDVGYIVGLAKNKRLNAQAEMGMAWAKAGYEHTGEKQRFCADLRHGAKSWGKRRRVSARLEHGAPKGNKGGANPRYVVTNLEGAGQALYDELYCQRGEMENRIKEQQLDLFADRTSCHAPNPSIAQKQHRRRQNTAANRRSISRRRNQNPKSLGQSQNPYFRIIRDVSGLERFQFSLTHILNLRNSWRIRLP